MPSSCPRCSKTIPPDARYCGRCGLALTTSLDGRLVAGRMRDPNAIEPPRDYRSIPDAADLYYRTESAWGGERLLGTENIGVLVFNAGHPLRSAEFAVTGIDPSGKELFKATRRAGELPRGEATTVEIPSFEISSAPADIRIALVSAEFAAIED